MTQKISSTNKIWNIKTEETANAKSIVNIIAKNRNISDDFFNLSIKTTMPDPYVFVDMQKAVERIVKAIENSECIAILGDYDVDGVSSTAIFVKFFKTIGAKYKSQIPDRMKDGYGLNINNIDKYKDCLIITVDNGSTALNELKYAHDLGVEIIVVDHHEMTVVPENTIVVNPFRPDDTCDFKYLCATGLAFMCVIAINRLLREKGFYKDKKEPHLLDYVDLVTLATICDVVPLINLNRAFVKTGLKVISQQKNPGIKAMMDLAIKKDVDSESVGFFFGPRLNASGRLSSADISLQLLTTDNFDKAITLAKELELLNEERKLLDQEIKEEAEQQVDISEKFICAFGKDWHPGVIGIVAGRLKEKFNKPSIVIACDSDLCHASCRSTENVDISKVIQGGIEKGIILSGGGHTCAGGFVIEQNKIADLIEFLKNYDFPEPVAKQFDVECYINESDINDGLISQINKFEPFGEGNPKPYFVITGLIIEKIKIIKEAHISINFYAHPEIRGISFKTARTDFERIIRENIGNKIDILGQISINEWRGQSYINLLVEDIRVVAK